jgi:hypothetical protein
MHVASLKTETREVPVKAAVALPQRPAPTSADRPATAAEPASTKSKDRPGLAAAKFSAKAIQSSHLAMKAAPVRTGGHADATLKKSVDKPALGRSKSVTKHVRLARTDPLAPLPEKHSGKTKDALTGR